MPQLVEDAGGELSAGAVFKRYRLGGSEHRETLGGRAVVGKIVAGGFAVTHPAADPGRGPRRYTVATVRTALPSGGRRTWWACPVCGRRAESLYLPTGRDRLACRRCCGLTYRSQTTAAPVAVRKARPAVWVETVTEQWAFHPAAGRLVLESVRKRFRRL